ncbi:MAG TPA: hypothetical protein VFO65_09635 [Acidimicrobiales bacterium]|nr:hypothetical protein [Acidimicrobiales bacterium]
MLTLLQATAGNRAVSSLVGGHLPVQRVGAGVFAGTGANLLNVTSAEERLGKSVSKNADHAERKAWEAAKGKVRARARENRQDVLTVMIAVDKGICHHCQVWMENQVLGVLHGWDAELGRTQPSKLVVEVKLKNKPAVTRDVTKGVTDWSGISYSGSIRDLPRDALKQIRGETW